MRIFNTDMVPQMSESWVFGFQIQVVPEPLFLSSRPAVASKPGVRLDPRIRAYNQGNGGAWGQVLGR